MRKMIGAMGAALALFATSAAAQPFDDDGLGWGPYYNNHLSPYNGAPAWTAAQRAAARGGILQRPASGRVHRDSGARLRA